MPQFYEDSNAHRGSKWALIHPDDPSVSKHFKFYENVCRNRGWLVRLFSSEEDALAWLP